MILVIDALNRHRFGSVLDDMYKLRARVFKDRMGWDVKVRNGREFDLFDDLDPAYLVALDDDYQVVGCNRMLQTTGPHMLADVFQDILCGEPPLRSATVWENTRFCIDTDRIKRKNDGRSVSYTACELMAGIAEYAYDSGISDVISVVDPAMDRILWTVSSSAATMPPATISAKPCRWAKPRRSPLSATSQRNGSTASAPSQVSPATSSRTRIPLPKPSPHGVKARTSHPT